MADINLKKNILISAASRIAVMFVSFLTGLITARYLGVELKGQYTYLISLCSFAWIALDLGIQKTYPYLIRREPERQKVLFTWSVLQFALELLMLGSLGLLFRETWSQLLSFAFTPAHVLLVVGAITLTKLSLQMQMYFLGRDKVAQNSLYQFLNSFSMLILVGLGFLLLRDVQRLLYVLLCYDLAMFVGVAAYTHRVLFGRFWNGFELRYILRAYSMGWRVFLSGLFITFLIRIDVVIIRHLLGFAELGIYAVGANIVEMLQMAANMVGGLLLVKLSDTKDDIVRWILLKKVFMAFFIILSTANLLFVVAGKPLLAVLYGAPFVPVYDVYLWLIPASFGLAFGSLFNTYLWSKGFPLISVLLPLLALLAKVALNFLLIPLMGIRGSALATSIAYLLWFVMILLYEQRLSRGKMLHHLFPSGTDFKEMSQELLADVQALLPSSRRNKTNH